jgi:hypothetical protein
MPWRPYLLSFLALAFLFVPVIFFFGLAGLVAPCCYGLYAMLNLGPSDQIIFAVFLVYLVIYFGLFFLMAFLSFRLSTLFAKKSVRTSIQVAFLLLLFSCSFLTVIMEGGGMVNTSQSGTYNFWTACARFPHSPRR